MIREMSRQSDPQEMVRAYGDRVRRLLPVDRRIALSRRDLATPEFRITRFSEWPEVINPWKEKHRLPLLSGGLFAELIYSNQPVILDHLDIDPSDPAYPYLEGQKSLMAIPMLDHGESLNMVISTRTQERGFDQERLPDAFWLANLFGRATHNLVLKEEVRSAYDAVDRELKVVSSIQRALLPRTMPEIRGIELAAVYETSQRAGGDYYDFFPLDNDRWGLLIADVSGHGTPAAVLMAITHSIAHLCPDDRGRPEQLLSFLNRHLADRYTSSLDAFVTAFYGVYDPATSTLTYSSAGHNPPRWWQCVSQSASGLELATGLPLGMFADADYESAQVRLGVGDRVVLYTDGITEASGRSGEQFGLSRLDDAIAGACRSGAMDIKTAIMRQLDLHMNGDRPGDDRTLVVMKVGSTT